MRPPVLTASLSTQGLESPTVGRWVPTISTSDSVGEGVILGRLFQAGRWRTVQAPLGAGGVVATVLVSQSRVECGTVLVELVAGEVLAISEGAEIGPPEGVETIDAPMVGTLFRQSAPGKPVYAAEGDRVSNNQTVGLIEVMKTLTPIRAGAAGRIVKWLVANGEPVSQGQAIAWLAVEAE